MNQKTGPPFPRMPFSKEVHIKKYLGLKKMKETAMNRESKTNMREEQQEMK